MSMQYFDVCINFMGSLSRWVLLVVVVSAVQCEASVLAHFFGPETWIGGCINSIGSNLCISFVLAGLTVFLLHTKPWQSSADGSDSSVSDIRFLGGVCVGRCPLNQCIKEDFRSSEAHIYSLLLGELDEMDRIRDDFQRSLVSKYYVAVITTFNS